jgi:hypothetical protein
MQHSEYFSRRLGIYADLALIIWSRKSNPVEEDDYSIWFKGMDYDLIKLWVVFLDEVSSFSYAFCSLFLVYFLQNYLSLLGVFVFDDFGKCSALRVYA